MARTVVAISVLALCGSIMIFIITMVAARVINEHCSPEMAWNGNC